MSILILSIISFMLAFLPFFKTMLITIFMAVCTIILSVIYGKKQKSDPKEKNKHELPIIAIIISIMAIIFSIVNYNKIPVEEPQDDIIASKIETFLEYYKNEEVNIDNKIKLTVNNMNFDGNKCIVDVKVTSLEDDLKVTLSNFFIYNSQTEELVFADSSASGELSYYSKLENEETIADSIIFECENIQDTSNIYLIYRDNVSSVKIKL
ncbi:MAG: hypothetical protein J6A15_04830 [Clostridia bacterium]|nr:hypothetical protein [Clostridia bacterium]